MGGRVGMRVRENPAKRPGNLQVSFLREATSAMRSVD